MVVIGVLLAILRAAQLTGTCLMSGPNSQCSSREIGDGEIEHLVCPSVHHSLYHVEREPLGHLEGDLGRHGEFLPVYDGINQHRPIMSEGGRDAGLNIGCVLEADAANSHGLPLRPQLGPHPPVGPIMGSVP